MNWDSYYYLGYFLSICIVWKKKWFRTILWRFFFFSFSPSPSDCVALDQIEGKICALCRSHNIVSSSQLLEIILVHVEPLASWFAHKYIRDVLCSAQILLRIYTYLLYLQTMANRSKEFSFHIIIICSTMRRNSRQCEWAARWWAGTMKVDKEFQFYIFTKVFKISHLTDEYKRTHS